MRSAAARLELLLHLEASTERKSPLALDALPPGSVLWLSLDHYERVDDILALKRTMDVGIETSVILKAFCKPKTDHAIWLLAPDTVSFQLFGICMIDSLTQSSHKERGSSVVVPTLLSARSSSTTSRIMYTRLRPTVPSSYRCIYAASRVVLERVLPPQDQLAKAQSPTARSTFDISYFR